MRRLLAPAALLLGRLPLALKFLVVGLVLVVPLGVVVYAYVDTESGVVAFSAKERIGITTMSPLLRLMSDVADARHEAAIGERITVIPAQDIALAESAQKRSGRVLRTLHEWNGLSAELSSARYPGGPAAVRQYDAIAAALERLIVHVGDGSNLTLDPDLDSYYLMDAIQFRTPLLIDTVSRVADQWHGAAFNRQRLNLQSDTGIALGTIESSNAALDNSVRTAAAHTRNPAVRTLLPEQLTKLDAQIRRFDARLRLIEAARQPPAFNPNARPSLRAARALSDAATVELDQLLAARISRSEAKAHQIELLAALAALAAMYLFGGFYLCVARPVGRMVATLRAVASGDHTQRVEINNRDELGFVARVLNDMVDKVRLATQKLEHDATHDILTGLPNRAYVIRKLERMLPRVREEHSLSVLFIDLDGFKLINDSIGHSAGDEVLSAVAARLVEASRPSDLIARLAGDEFLVVCTELPDVDAVLTIAHRMLEVISPEIAVHDAAGDPHQVTVGASIGVTFVTEPSVSAEQLVRDADVAMYRAKQRGRGDVEVFGESLRKAVQERQFLREELRRAITQEELVVYYQPIVEVASRHTIGFEALVRWNHPQRGLLAPGAFMAIAEDSWLISALGGYVLHEACRQLRRWLEDPAMPADIHMAVNLSARQLTDPELVPVVTAALSQTGIEPGALCLEITETALLADPSAAAEALWMLRAKGVRLALDDFGTGYSSLQHLKDFPLDVIKLDRTFVAGLAHEDPAAGGDEAIIRAVIDLARAFRLNVVAEGVETPGQHARLLQLGCPAAQGYLFGRPSPPSHWSEISDDRADGLSSADSLGASAALPRATAQREPPRAAA